MTGKEYKSLDFETRPQWGIVNVEILVPHFNMIKNFNAWLMRKAQGSTGKIENYYLWRSYVEETYLKLMSHIETSIPEKDGKLAEEYSEYEVFKKLDEYFVGRPRPSDKEYVQCMKMLIRFVHILGLTKIESEPTGKITVFD